MSDQTGMLRHLKGPLQHNSSALPKGEMGGPACSYSSRKVLGDHSQALKSKFQPGKLGSTSNTSAFCMEFKACAPQSQCFFPPARPSWVRGDLRDNESSHWEVIKLFFSPCERQNAPLVLVIKVFCQPQE